jgi:hypothetical protein
LRPMYTNQLSTGDARPAGVLISNELPNPQSFDLPQILHHAHAIFCPISFVQIVQALTREGRTRVITVFSRTFVAETESAFLAAFGVGRQTAITLVLGTYISNAKTAVHSTGGYVRYLGIRFHEGQCTYLLAKHICSMTDVAASGRVMCTPNIGLAIYCNCSQRLRH